jgi:hypothetical protein
VPRRAPCAQAEPPRAFDTLPVRLIQSDFFNRKFGQFLVNVPKTPVEEQTRVPDLKGKSWFCRRFPFNTANSSS